MEGGLLPSTSTINRCIDLESFVTYVVSQSLSLSICKILDYSQSLAVSRYRSCHLDHKEEREQKE